MSGQGEDRGNRSRDRVFFTLRPEKKVAGWFLGVSSARRTAKAFGEFKETMLHGDQKKAYWVAGAPRKDRVVLARRVSREAFIYIAIGGILGVSSFWSGVSDGLSGELDGGMFWLTMGLLSSVIGAWIGTVKLWQAHNVREASSLTLREFLNMPGRRPEDGSNEESHGG